MIDAGVGGEAGNLRGVGREHGAVFKAAQHLDVVARRERVDRRGIAVHDEARAILRLTRDMALQVDGQMRAMFRLRAAQPEDGQDDQRTNG